MKTIDTSLTFAESARWLIHFITFSDKSYKNAFMQIPNRTWGSKLSMIALKGKTLFETLLLNYVAESSLRNVPSWETDIQRPLADESHRENCYLVAMPDNQASLLTLQSRQVFLCREQNKVIGYYVAGGDYFNEEEVFNEHMTLWRSWKDKKTGMYIFSPLKGGSLTRAWQEFGCIAVTSGNNDSSKGFRIPGVMHWIHTLMQYGIIKRSDMINVEIAAVVYDENDQKSLCIKDTISDSLTFHAQLLQEAGAEWRVLIQDEISRCEDAAKAVYHLYKDLQKANGRRDKDGKTEQSGELDARTEFYERIDRPFRLWLADLDPAQADRIDYPQELERQLRDIALRFGNELAAQSDSAAIFGRYLKEQGEITSSAAALNQFTYLIRKKIFTRAGDMS